MAVRDVVAQRVDDEQVDWSIRYMIWHDPERAKNDGDDVWDAAAVIRGHIAALEAEIKALRRES